MYPHPAKTKQVQIAMFGSSSQSEKFSVSGNSVRRGSLYESRVWGTGLSPPQKHYSVDFSVLDPSPDSLYLPNGPATGLAAQKYINSHVQGLQQVRSGIESAMRDPDVRKNSFFLGDESGSPLEYSAPLANPVLGPDQNANFSVNVVNPNFNFHGLRTRAFSDASSIQSTNTALSAEFSSPLAASSGCPQTSPIMPYAAPKFQPAGHYPSVSGAFGSNMGFQPNQRLVGEAEDRHFTYKPPNAGSTTISFPPAAARSGPLMAFQRALGQPPVAHPDEQFWYWNGLPHSAWNASGNNENSFQTGTDSFQQNPAFSRYSCCDMYQPALAGPMKHSQSQKTYNPPVHGHKNPASVNSKAIQIVDEKTLLAVDQYFTQDVHQRVKISAELFAQRCIEDQKYLEDQYQLPQYPLDSPVRSLKLVLVCFKAGRLDVFYLPEEKHNLRSINVGDLIIVEADRGRDLGKVSQMNITVDQARLLKLLQFLEQLVALNERGTGELTLAAFHHGPHGTKGGGEGVYFAPPTLYCPKPIISLALRAEMLLILNKSHDEEKACRLSLAKIASTLNQLNAGETKGTLTLAELNQMRLIDAEYQFDRRKLIFYYSTCKRIDFRDLVRELFRIYKTRIWMCAVNGISYQPAYKKAPAKQQFARSAETLASERPERRMSAQLTSPLMNAPDASYFGADAAGLDYDDIPRNFCNERSACTEESPSRGESLVLKSLVDTLNN